MSSERASVGQAAQGVKKGAIGVNRASSFVEQEWPPVLGEVRATSSHEQLEDPSRKEFVRAGAASP
jgi:hypothetical protein